MSRGTRLLLSAVGGATTAAAFTAWPVQLLVPVGVALLVLAAHRAPWRVALSSGGLFGLVFLGWTLHWLAPSIGVTAWIALTLVQAAWLALCGLAIALTSRLPGWPAWAAVSWTATENLRASQPLGGMPWGRLAFTTPDTPWAALLPLLGATGTTLVLAGLGAALAAGAFSIRRRPGWALVVAGAAGATLLVGVFTPPQSAASTDETVRVAIVQGGVPGSGTRVVDHHREVTDDHAAETVRLTSSPTWAADRPDFVLWPENATAVDPGEDERARIALISSTQAAGVPVLAGSVTDGPSSSTARNQAIVWTDSGPAARYTKQHLVPFGEYVPFRWLASRASSRVAQIRRDMLPGPRADALPVGGVRVAVALCFDIAYDDVLGPQIGDGAGLVTVLTSNAMFLGTAQLDQQWTITRARALETGRSVLVASVNGVSGAIGPDGAVLERLPARETTSAVVTVPWTTRTTPAVRMGPWPGRAVYAAAAVALLLVVRRRRRNPGAAPGRWRADASRRQQSATAGAHTNTAHAAASCPEVSRRPRPSPP